MATTEVDAVVPIRVSDAVNPDGSPRLVLEGRPLWEWTIDRAVNSGVLRRVIVAYDDPDFAARLAPWGDRITHLQRPLSLSRRGVTVLDVMRYVAGTTVRAGDAPDYLMLLEITHPLRPAGIIRQLVEAIAASPADCLFTALSVRYNYWRREGAGGPITRITGQGDDPDAELYQELLGICSLFRPARLMSDDCFGENVDLVPIDRFWASIDVRDEEGLWLAEQYLARVRAGGRGEV